MFHLYTLVIYSISIMHTAEKGYTDIQAFWGWFIKQSEARTYERMLEVLKLILLLQNLTVIFFENLEHTLYPSFRLFKESGFLI